MEVVINKKDRVRKNITTLAIYNALFYDNRHREKALVSITIGDEKLISLFELRKYMMNKLKSIMKKKAYKNQTIAYFTNIEFGADKGELKEFNPHIHMQFFYDDFEPIQETMAFVEEKFDVKNTDVNIAEKKDAYFGYVVKDYVIANYDEKYELNKKEQGKGMPFYTASRKAISNYVIKYIYGYLAKAIPVKWRALEYNKRYEYILELIKSGHIQVVEIDDNLSDEYIIVKNRAICISTIDTNDTIKNNIS